LIIDCKVDIQVDLHLVDALVELGAADDPEVLVEQGTVETFHNAITLRSADLRRAMLNLLELKEELEWVLVGPAAILPTVVAQDRVDMGAMLLEEGQDSLVEDVDGGDGNLRVVEMASGIAGMAIDNGLQVDLADAFEIPDHEGVDGDELACEISLDMTLSELRIEAFEELNVMVG
jgi:hypothetical protein